MDKFTEKIFAAAKTERLSANEKASIRASVVSFAHAHSVARKTASPYTRHFSIFTFMAERRYSMSLAVLLILVLSGGTSFAAASALPGELLYTVKLNVNENVESLLAVSTQAAAEVNAKHAVSRLKEAETLATTGKLTPEVNKEIEQNFAASITSLNKNTESLKESGDFKAIAVVTDNLEHGINAHYASLQAVESSAISDGNAQASDTAPAENTASEDSKVMMMAPMAMTAPSTSSPEATQTKSKTMAARDIGNDAAGEQEFAKSSIAEVRALIGVAAAQATSSTPSMKAAVRGTVVTRAQVVSVNIKALQASARLTLADQYMLLGKAAEDQGDDQLASSFFKKAESAAGDAKNIFNDDSDQGEGSVHIDQNMEQGSTTSGKIRSWFNGGRGRNDN